MLLGFMSLLLTIGQGIISEICVPKSVGATLHPCSKQEKDPSEDEYAGSYDKCAEKACCLDSYNCAPTLIFTVDLVRALRKHQSYS